MSSFHHIFCRELQRYSNRDSGGSAIHGTNPEVYNREKLVFPSLENTLKRLSTM